MKSSRRPITLFGAGNRLFFSLEICDLFIKQAYRAANENETSTPNCTAAAHTFILFAILLIVLEIIVVVFLKKTLSDFFIIFNFTRDSLARQWAKRSSIVACRSLWFSISVYEVSLFWRNSLLELINFTISFFVSGRNHSGMIT